MSQPDWESELVPQRPESETEWDESTDYRPPPRRIPAYPRRKLSGGHITVIVLMVISTLSCITTMLTNKLPAAAIAVVATIATTFIGLRVGRGSLAQAEADFEEQLRENKEHGLPIPERVRAVLAENGEQVWVIANEHPIVIVPLIVFGIVTQLAGGWLLSTMAKHGAHLPFLVEAGAWVVLVAPFVYRFVKWWRTLFVITNQYVLLFDGVFSEAHKRQPVAVLTGVTTRIPWYSRLLGFLRITRERFGTFTLEDAGQDQAINKVNWLAGIRTLEKVLAALARGNEPFKQIDPAMLADGEEDYPPPPA